jgi:hypothetical protein
MKKKPRPRKGADSTCFNDQPPPATIASLPAAICHQGLMTHIAETVDGEAENVSREIPEEARCTSNPASDDGTSAQISTSSQLE